MKEFEFNIDLVEKLIDLAKKKDVSKLEVSYKEFSVIVDLAEKRAITLGENENRTKIVNFSEVSYKEEVKENGELEGNILRSPIVGTFYSKASPESEDFVQIGDMVKKGDVVCIIESMKLMNEIKSEFEGKVSKILVKNGEGVEYDQALIILE